MRITELCQFTWMDIRDKSTFRSIQSKLCSEDDARFGEPFSWLETCCDWWSCFRIDKHWRLIGWGQIRRGITVKPTERNWSSAIQEPAGGEAEQGHLYCDTGPWDGEEGRDGARGTEPEWETDSCVFNIPVLNQFIIDQENKIPFLTAVMRFIQWGPYCVVILFFGQFAP